jgi:hypothetical protein
MIKIITNMNNLFSLFQDNLLPQKLRYNPKSVIQNSSQIKGNSQVVKYGFKTKLTSGKYHCSGSSKKFTMDGHFYPEGRHQRRTKEYILNDQIQIRDDCGKFSDTGDSGAMVFYTNENKELMALGIVTGRLDGIKTTFVTPIWNILEEIAIQRPYQLAELRSPRKIIEELKRSALSIAKTCDDLARVLKH